MLHIRESKCKKDRYVPVSYMLIQGIQKYINSTHPKEWLFNGKVRGNQISREGIRHAIRTARKKAGITKEACVHTLVVFKSAREPPGIKPTNNSQTPNYEFYNL